MCHMMLVMCHVIHCNRTRVPSPSKSVSTDSSDEADRSPSSLAFSMASKCAFLAARYCLSRV